MSLVRKRMNSVTYWPRLEKDLRYKFRLERPRFEHQDRHNLEFSSDIRSTMFSKSADVRQKSTIRALFKANSVDPKTHLPPSFHFRIELSHLFTLQAKSCLIFLIFLEDLGGLCSQATPNFACKMFFKQDLFLPFRRRYLKISLSASRG